MILAAVVAVASQPVAVAPQSEICKEDEVSNDCIRRKSKPWEQGSVFGVRIGVTNVHGAEKSGTYVGAMAAASSEQFSVGQIFSGHGFSHASLGGGSAGLEGGIGGTLTLGFRVPIGTTHGPIARIGAGGELLGNSQFYFSRLALPVAEVGYQYASAKRILEIGARGGAVLSGRYNTGDRTRRELGGGSFEWGGYIAAHSPTGRIDVSYMRIEARENYPGGGVGNLRGNGCFYLGSFVAICADAMIINGDGYIGLPRQSFDVTTFYAGGTFGFLDW